MEAYSLDLRKKIVEAKERGMPTSEVAKTFGVGVSPVKRYAAAAHQGRSLAPKKHPGSKPKLDEAARKLLEADLGERPAATLPERREFLRQAAVVEVSDSTGFVLVDWSLGRAIRFEGPGLTSRNCQAKGLRECRSLNGARLLAS
jgi:transposase